MRVAWPKRMWLSTKRQNLFGIVFGESQPPADFLRHFHAHFNVIIKADAVRSDAKSRRLTHIVQQRSPGQRHWTWIRQVVEQQAAYAQTHRPRDETPRGCSTPFIAEISGRIGLSNPLSSNKRNARRAWPSVNMRVSSSRTRSRETTWICSASVCIAENVAGSIAYSKRAANRTARSMRNLSSPKRRSGSPMARMIPAFRSLRPPTKSKHFPADRIEHHAVDREIPAGHIFPRIETESYFVGMATVGVADIAAKSRDFNCVRLRRTFRRDVARNVSLRRRHQYHAELRANRIGLRENAHHLFRRRVRRYVIILRLAPEQQIAHASTHQISLKAALAQGLDDRG